MKYEIEITTKAKSDIRGIYGTACSGNCRKSARPVGKKHFGARFYAVKIQKIRIGTVAVERTAHNAG